jgi:hypothetical protein
MRGQTGVLALADRNGHESPPSRSHVAPPDPVARRPHHLEQADAIVGHYADDAGELATGVVATRREEGYRVHGMHVITAEDLVRTWNAPSDVSVIALVHYASSSSVVFGAVPIRLDKITGMIFVLDGRGMLA